MQDSSIGTRWTASLRLLTPFIVLETIPPTASANSTSPTFAVSNIISKPSGSCHLFCYPSALTLAQPQVLPAPDRRQSCQYILPLKESNTMSDFHKGWQRRQFKANVFGHNVQNQIQNSQSNVKNKTKKFSLNLNCRSPETFLCSSLSTQANKRNNLHLHISQVCLAFNQNHLVHSFSCPYESFMSGWPEALTEAQHIITADHNISFPIQLVIRFFFKSIV